MELLFKNEISKYLDELGKELDITENEYENIVKSYEAVGGWLSDEKSLLKEYNPIIKPQGSFMLGTVVKPINEEDDIDIDLVCQLEKKPSTWTQKNLKDEVGKRLKLNSNYDRMLKDFKDGEYYKDGGRRCWTLKYSNAVGYHMDILPAFSDENLSIIVERLFSVDKELDSTDLNKMAIRITDTEKSNYNIDTNIDNWSKSNPFAYAIWFLKEARKVSGKEFFSLNESVDPVRAYEKNKLPLQRVIQLLKRHRDIMFSNDEFERDNKPISVIITTLATRAYDKSENLLDAYSNIVKNMRNYIETKYNSETREYEKWVVNPINKDENFADKWSEVFQKEEYFYLWLDKLEEDLENIYSSNGKGLVFLNESFSNMYGKDVTKQVFENQGNSNRLLREQGKIRMAERTGIIGSIGIKVANHNFEGINEK